MKKLLYKYRFVFSLLFLLLLSACGNSDIKDNYCGVRINAAYCKCAFHNELCGSVGMSKGEANAYVHEKYNDWKTGDNTKLKEDCAKKNGYVSGSTCFKCDQDEIALEGKCERIEDEEAAEEGEEQDNEEPGDEEEGECKYDSDCDAICEDGVYWKMGCNARTDSCEKTFETDCFAERTSVGSFTFAKSCTTDGCVDNKEKVAAFRDSLSADALKFHNLMQEVERARVQAHNNCLSALSDVTNKFIIDSAITFAGVAGLRSDLSYQSQAQFSKFVQPSGSAVESLATAQVTGPVQGLLDKLGSMAMDDGKPKMKVEDYIDLNCNAAKDLATEHARLAQERDIIIELAKPMKGW